MEFDNLQNWLSLLLPKREQGETLISCTLTNCNLAKVDFVYWHHLTNLWNRKVFFFFFFCYGMSKLEHCSCCCDKTEAQTIDYDWKGKRYLKQLTINYTWAVRTHVLHIVNCSVCGEVIYFGLLIGWFTSDRKWNSSLGCSGARAGVMDRWINGCVLKAFLINIFNRSTYQRLLIVAKP